MAATADEVLTTMFARHLEERQAHRNALAKYLHHPKLRTDLWVRAFDGLYRFWLSPEQLAKLEDDLAHIDQDGVRRASGVMRLYGAVAKGRYELEGRSVGFAAEGEVSIQDCRRIITDALIGGSAAIIKGEMVNVPAVLADQLVQAHLVNSPMIETWSLAFAILDTAIHGRPRTENEEGWSSANPVGPREGEEHQLADESNVGSH